MTTSSVLLIMINNFHKKLSLPVNHSSFRNCPKGNTISMIRRIGSQKETNRWPGRKETIDRSQESLPEGSIHASGPGYTDTFSFENATIWLRFHFLFTRKRWNDHETANIWIRNPMWIDLKTQQNKNGTIWKRIRVNEALRLLLTQRFLTFWCVACVKIKDTDDVLPVKEGSQLPWW